MLGIRHRACEGLLYNVDGGVTVCIIEKGQKPKKKTWPTVTGRGQAQKVENTARGLQDNLQ